MGSGCNVVTFDEVARRPLDLAAPPNDDTQPALPDLGHGSLELVLAPVPDGVAKATMLSEYDMGTKVQISCCL